MRPALNHEEWDQLAGLPVALDADVPKNPLFEEKHPRDHGKFSKFRGAGAATEQPRVGAHPDAQTRFPTPHEDGRLAEQRCRMLDTLSAPYDPSLNAYEYNHYYPNYARDPERQRAAYEAARARFEKDVARQRGEISEVDDAVERALSGDVSGIESLPTYKYHTVSSIRGINDGMHNYRRLARNSFGSLADRRAANHAKFAAKFISALPSVIDDVSDITTASGAVVTARLTADASKIGDHYYAKAMAAYGEQGPHHQTDDTGLTGHYNRRVTDPEQTVIDDDITDVVEDAAREVLDGCDAYERQSIDNYIDPAGYTKINGPLRRKTPIVTDEARALLRVIARSHVPADLHVYRGLNRAGLRRLTGYDSPESAVGGYFVHNCFASTARRKNVSRFFADYENDPGNSVAMKFAIPAGTNALMMPNQDDTTEVVLPPRGVFRIDAVSSEPGFAAHVLHCTYLGTQIKRPAARRSTSTKKSE